MNDYLRWLFFTCLLCCYSIGYGQGLEIFVSPNGDDAGDGSKDRPLKSLEGARNKIRVLKNVNVYNDTVRINIGPGLYPILSTFSLKPQDSGTEAAPVIYQGSVSGTIISGGINLNGFKETDDGLWAAHIPEVAYWNWTFDQLYVNGRRAVRAKSPNEGFFYMEDLKEEVWVMGTGRAPERAQQIVTTDAAASRELKKIDEMALSQTIMTAYHNWDITKRHIDKYDIEENKLYTSGQGMKPWNPLKPGKRFILENYKAALDQPGEWFLKEDGMLYYMPYPHEKIETAEFIAPVLEQLVRIEGDPVKSSFVENIIFRDIQFSHSANYLDHEGFEPNQAAIAIPASVELNGAKNIVFENCQLSHLGGYALWMNQGVSQCKVKHSLMRDMGAGGIRIGETLVREEKDLSTFDNLVDNNIITSGGHEFPPAVGVWIGQSADNTVTHNDISDFRYTGVSVGWRWGYDYSPAKGNRIMYNHIHHIGWGLLSDMSGVYTLGPSEGTEVSNNHVHHIYAFDYGGWGLYTDEGSSNIILENNLVHHTKTGGFHQHYGRENILRNNIFAFSKMFQLQATRVEDHLSFTFSNNIVLYNEGVLYQGPWTEMNVKIDQNIYWNFNRPVYFLDESLKDWQKNGYDRRSYIQDPGFKDPINGVFSFKNLKIAKKIDFKPFDYTSYGVYGSESWKNEAKLPDPIIEAFNNFFSKESISSK